MVPLYQNGRGVTDAWIEANPVRYQHLWDRSITVLDKQEAETDALNEAETKRVAAALLVIEQQQIANEQEVEEPKASYRLGILEC